MANNEYSITIEIPEGGGSRSVMSGGSLKQQQTDEEKRSEDTSKAVKKMVSYTGAIALAGKLVSYKVSQVSLRTGASEYEEKWRFRLQWFGGAGSAGATIGAAAAVNPALGAAAAVGIGLNYLITYAQNVNTINTKSNLEDISISMASRRAGVSGRRSANQ